MRILNVAAGVLLIAAGIYCLCNQDVALLSAGLLLGIFLLLSGVAEIVVFAAASGVMLGSGWLLLDGKQMCIMLGGISMKTAYKLLGNGEIHHLKIGKSFKIPKICVIEYLLG